MKLKLVSDLHLEFDKDKNFHIPYDGEDVLVLAGDIQMGLTEDWFFHKCLEQRHVIYVLGNHEYYKQNMDKLHSKLFTEWKLKFNNDSQYQLHILHKDVIYIDDVKFVGGTLWTDFGEENPTVMHLAPYYMNDYRHIRMFDSYSRLTPYRIYKEYKECVKVINNHCDDAVVITHHLPSYKSIHHRFKNNEYEKFNPYYYSNLDHLVKRSKLWLHGHTHDSFQYDNVYCNPRGYNGSNKSFNPHLIIEIN